ncbi:protein of unknown function [Aquiflexum balticum DSM 16537]|uniref:Uncharacterized protein n=1 Tax=Aquiflexum balticum DSM 16537 TaxID=758820 RepID=A0A1W2H071_9BACT|nr:DUF5034 domain-containing protein [Aquiflexum balticum]SMD42028.1 protein of unknown function [Aquiflexum balticum DSM 16537]
MKNLQQYLVVSIILFSSLIQSSCEDKCEETKYEIKEISLKPKTRSAGETLLSPWISANQLPYNRLMFELSFPKPVLVFFTLNATCPVVWTNNNRVSDIKLLSNQDYNENFPAGSDLLEIASFTVDNKFFFEKDLFLKDYINKSELTTAYFYLNESPVDNLNHTLRFVAELADGNSIETSGINVLLKSEE